MHGPYLNGKRKMGRPQGSQNPLPKLHQRSAVPQHTHLRRGRGQGLGKQQPPWTERLIVIREAALVYLGDGSQQLPNTGLSRSLWGLQVAFVYLVYGCHHLLYL